MNIRDLNAGTLRPDRMRSGSTEQTEQTRVQPNQGAEQASGAATPTTDRVEISDSGRAAQTEGDKRATELAFAQRALTEIPPLSEERAKQIIERVEEGYYSKPENVKQIAEQLARELRGA